MPKYCRASGGSPLNYAHLAVELVSMTIECTDNEKALVVVAVEGKPSTIRPNMPNTLEHHCTVLLIEGIACIKEKKAIVRLMSMGFPKIVCCMNSTLSANWNTNTKLVSTIGRCCSITSGLENNLGKSRAPDLTNPNGVNPRTFV
jgi:hypothetical protein